MTMFSADTLDLSRFPAPLAIRDIDHQAILIERLTHLKELLTAAGIPFDTDELEPEPGAYLQQIDAWRELLALARVNDAVRSVMVAFATGADLDHLAITAATGLPKSSRDLMLRRVIGTRNGVDVLEGDEEYRRRILLAPEAYTTAGSHGAYVFHGLSADGRVLNVDVWSPGGGRVEIAVQSREGDGVAPDDLVAAVRLHLHRKEIKPLTAEVNVRSITNFPYRVEVEGFVLPGPSPALIQEEMALKLQAMAAARRTPTRDVPRSAVFAAASVGAVDKVFVKSPATDIARGHGEVAVCTGLDVKVTTYAG